MAKIYISSTYSDLTEYREAVYRALRRMGHDVIAMEDYVATDQRPLDKCLADMAACDVYVGIFAWRYGYIPNQDNPDQKSITELEYRQAGKTGKPCLVFLLDESAPWLATSMDAVTGKGDEGKRITEFRQELSQEKLLSFFKTPDELAGLVGTAVHNWEKENRQKEEPAAGPSAEHAPTVTTPTPQPREVTHHAFLAYADMDEEFVRQLSHQLMLRGRSLYLSPLALFAKQQTDFQDLENAVRQCHTAIVVLSDTLLNRMEAQRERTKRILHILQSRTGRVISLCRTENSLKRAADWEFSQPIDVNTWESESGFLVSQIDRAVMASCPISEVRTVGLPLIVIAMTYDEALELHQHPELLEQELGARTFQQFRALKKALEPYRATSFVQRYDSARVGWKPFVGSNRTITVVIEDAVQYLNDIHPPRLRGRLIKIQYYSFDALVNKEKELRHIYYEIAQTGCVVLLDEFSMFHPNVRTSFGESPLFSSEQVALVTISPFDPYSLAPNQVLENELRKRLAVAFDRFALDYDPQCEFGVGNEHRLKRWLYRSLPEALHTLREPRPNRRSLKQFIEKVGQEPHPDIPSLL